MSAEAWAPDGAKDLGAAVRQAVGAGSMCWESVAAAGVFRDDQANSIANGLVEWIQARTTLDSVPITEDEAFHVVTEPGQRFGIKEWVDSERRAHLTAIVVSA